MITLGFRPLPGFYSYKLETRDNSKHCNVSVPFRGSILTNEYQDVKVMIAHKVSVPFRGSILTNMITYNFCRAAIVSVPFRGSILTNDFL